MYDPLTRIRRILNTSTDKKMFRYTMVSVVSTALTFSLLGIFFGVFRLWTEVPSTIVANAVMIVPYYYLNRRWVWGKTGRSHWRRELLPFWLLSTWGLLLSIVSAALARHISHANHLSHTAATAVLLTVTLTAFGIVWVIKFIIFNRMFRLAAPWGAPPAKTSPNRGKERPTLESAPIGSDFAMTPDNAIVGRLDVL
jgi:putative flippase GtrA